MLQFLIARLSSALVVVLGVVCLVFLLIHLVPGDPVEVMLGETAREYVIFGLVAVAAVELSHLGNIRRLIAGTEPKLGQGGGRRSGSGA